MAEGRFLTASLCTIADAHGMELSIIAASGTGSGELVVGLLVGCCIGILIGPAFRSWQVYREWAEASREARLADRLLERMEIDADLDGHDDPARSDDTAAGSTWQARR